MLRRCCLCARQLELSSSLYLHHYPPPPSHSESPIASSSSSGIAAEASTSSSSSASVTRYHSRPGFHHNVPSRRTYSSTSRAAQSEAAATVEGLRWNEQGTSSKSYWKGKARETEPTAPSYTTRTHQHDSRTSSTLSPTSSSGFVHAREEPAGAPSCDAPSTVSQAGPPPIDTTLAFDADPADEPRAADSSIEAADLLEQPTQQAPKLRGVLHHCKLVLRTIQSFLGESAIPDDGVVSELSTRLENLDFQSPVGSRLVGVRRDGELDSLASFLSAVLQQLLAVILERKVWTRLQSPLRKCLLSICNDRPDAAPTILEDIAVFLAERRISHITVYLLSDLDSISKLWTPRSIHLFLQAIEKTKQYQVTPHFNDLPTSLPSSIPLESYNCFIRSHLANNNLREARLFYRSMVQNELKPTVDTYNCIFEGYRALGYSEDLYEHILADQHGIGLPADTKVLNSFIEMHIAAGEMDRALEVFRLFRTGRPKPTLLSPQPAPAAAADCQAQLPFLSTATGEPVSMTATAPTTPAPPLTSYSPEIPATVASMTSPSPASEPVPDKSTFALFVRGYSQLGDLDRALDFYTRMMDEGFKPTKFLSQAIIKAYSNLGRIRDAQAIIASVEGAAQTSVQLAPTPSTPSSQAAGLYQAMLPGLLAKEGINGLKAVIRDMTVQGVVLTGTSIAMVLNYLSKSGKVSANKLASIADRIRNASPTFPTISELNVMLNSYTQRDAALSNTTSPKRRSSASQSPSLTMSFADRMDDRKMFMALLNQLYSAGITADAYTIAILMQRYAERKGNPATLWAYFRWQILDRGIRATPPHIAAVMTAYINVEDLYGARRALDRGQALGVRPNIHLYTILIQAFLRENNRMAADFIYKEMQEKGVKPDLHLYAVFAEWAAKYGTLAYVERIVQQGQGLHPSPSGAPDPVLQTTLFAARARRRGYWTAFRHLERAIEAGMPVDTPMLRVVARMVAEMRRNSRSSASKAASSARSRSPHAIEYANSVREKAKATFEKQQELKAYASGITDKNLEQLVDIILKNRLLAQQE